MVKPHYRLNHAQMIARRTYAGGEFQNEVLDPTFDVGDTLFTFIMRELADDDCKGSTDGLDEAIRRMSAAMKQIEDVIHAMDVTRSTLQGAK